MKGGSVERSMVGRRRRAPDQAPALKLGASGPGSVQEEGSIMWILIVLALFAAVACAAAFVRGARSSYWDSPHLLNGPAGHDWSDRDAA